MTEQVVNVLGTVTIVGYSMRKVEPDSILLTVVYLNVYSVCLLVLRSA